jgi:hypothetical protein
MRAMFLYAICLLPVSVFSAQSQSPQDAAKAKQMQEMLERNAAQSKLTPRETRPQFDNPNATRDLQESMKNGTKQQPDRWKASQDAQSKIVEMHKDVTASKARKQSKGPIKAPNKADEYIR